MPNYRVAGRPDWSASLNTPIDWSQWNVRLDYNISHSQTLMFRMTQDSWTNNSPNGNSTLGLWGDAIYPALNSNWAQPSKQIIARLTSTIGTSMVNDLEFAYSDNRINITPGGTDPGLLRADYGSDSDQLSVGAEDLQTRHSDFVGWLGQLHQRQHAVADCSLEEQSRHLHGSRRLLQGGRRADAAVWRVPGMERQERIQRIHQLH